MSIGRFLMSSGDTQWSAGSGYVKQVHEGRIVVGDCARVLPQIPDDCVDLIHTSPPYNIDKPYENAAGDRAPYEQYLTFLSGAIREMKRVLRPGGSIFWQTGYTQSPTNGEIVPIDILTYRMFTSGTIPMMLWDRIIWRYFGGHAFTKKFTNKHESVLWFVKPGEAPVFHVDEIREKSKEYDKRNNFWGRNPGNVWEVDRVASGSTEQTSHIAVYPEELSEKIIRACSLPENLVLDPFCGSGTTLKVARSLSRRWFGIEVSEAYAREAALRLGFQQPSEMTSLASELIKDVAFGGRKGTLQTTEVISRVRAWMRSVALDSAAQKFADDVAAATNDRTQSKSVKRAAWIDYDRRIERNTATDPIVRADALLLRCYKNRKNLNGVSRYSSAMTLLRSVVDKFSDSEEAVHEFIMRLIWEEPSTFSETHGRVTLRATQRRMPGQAEAEDPGVELAESRGLDDRDAGEDSWQGRLVF
jgi:adenine-specific DNA-methyltransferase